MNKKQAEKVFKMEFWDELKQKSKTDQRLAWNDFTEHLYQSDQITEKQLYTWDQPGFVKE